MRRAAIVATGMFLALVLASGASAAPRHHPTPPPASSAGPEAYVRWIYGRYIDHGNFDPLTPYSPAMRALFARNSKLLGDEVGDNNDGDEFCQCQDWGGLSILHLRTTPDGPGRATASLDVRNFGKLEAVTLKLVLTPRGWRVDDVLHSRSGASPSLRARLEDENRRLERPRR